MSTTESFLFGSVRLPEPVEKRAKAICETLNLTADQLYLKWEAWAVNNSKSSDVPTVSQLEQLATYIREKDNVVQENVSGGTTPRSLTRSRRRAAAASGGSSPFTKPPVAPIPMNIDDFFNYLPDGDETGQQASTKIEDSKIISDSQDDDVEMRNHFDEDENGGDVQNLKSEDTEAKDHLNKLKVEKQLNYDLSGDIVTTSLTILHYQVAMSKIQYMVSVWVLVEWKQHIVRLPKITHPCSRLRRLVFTFES